ncbi:MAG: hypothetical protein HC887_00595 [Desulfobacteraceae bacterium]|nr:hypothetical protein [Desulfobacteraceae bacterium]
MTRTDMGLPQNSFVFCSFTQAYKIELKMFEVWMKILKQTANSVLWLLPESPLTEANLRKEAEKRGISAARLIFTRRLDKPDHLTRHTLADLVLDTRIYNGHTTTSDALWAGVPVVAWKARIFASRVSSGLLKAVGLPQLVMQSLEEYESMAIRLSENPEELLTIRQQLAKKRLTEPLFDTPRFAKDIEQAYKAMWKTWLAGKGALVDV